MNFILMCDIIGSLKEFDMIYIWTFMFLSIIIITNRICNFFNFNDIYVVIYRMLILI